MWYKYQGIMLYFLFVQTETKNNTSLNKFRA